jgi:Peptidase S46
MRSCLFALLAACSSTPKSTAPENPDPTQVTQSVVVPPLPESPGFAARKAFKNPGGMWLPKQLALPAHVDALHAMGSQMTDKALTDPLGDPLNAVVTLGFCTGSFISPDGLMITNHHCAQGALDRNSTKDANLVENGFLAKTRADEKSAGPNHQVKIAQAFRDVSKEMRDGLEAIKDPKARYDELERRYKAFVAACEKDRPGIKCDITNTFHGAAYTLTEYLELRDVRLVYVPHRAIGNYGGEVDNWMWPRHTGDWAMFRAYVGKDGKPADYAADNVPFKPKHWLTIAKAPLAEHDLVVVAGYPGSTTRLDTYTETKFDVEVALPESVAVLKAMYDVATDLTAKGGNTGIKAGVLKQGLQNAIASYQGKIDGLLKGDALAQKQAAAAKVDAWLAQPGHEKARAAVTKLEEIRAERRKTAVTDRRRARAEGGSSLLDAAHVLVRMVEERGKPDAKRELGYQARDMPDLVGAQQAISKDYDATLDRALFKLGLMRALALPAAERPWLAMVVGTKQVDPITEAAIDAALDRLYTTKLTDEALRVKLLQTGTRAQLAALKDPMIDLALRLAPEQRKRELADKRRSAEIALLAPQLGDAQRDSAGGAIAPDANSTLRITYGTVRRFDGAGSPFTTATEILKKDKGTAPFDAPKPLLAAIEKRQWGRWASPAAGGSVPLDFISDVDTTGGNSGSPTFNAKGELVGLLFDGNLESVASDVVFNWAVTRSIHVDIRYAMWVMTQVDHADAIAKELGL